MKKNYFFVIFCLLFASCANNYGNKSFNIKHVDRTVYEMKSVFVDYKYPKVPDRSVISVSEYNKTYNGGKFLDVFHKYGLREIHSYFYEDMDGNIIKIKCGSVKDNGYPYADSVFYKINSDGYIVFDWIIAIFLMILTSTLIKIFTL